MTFPAGTALTYAFKLRIDTVIPNSAGTVYACEQFADDLAGGAGGTGGQGGGGSRPITGPVAGSIAGVGVLLLLPGGGPASSWPGGGAPGS
jgi:hypothetical protein